LKCLLSKIAGALPCALFEKTADGAARSENRTARGGIFAALIKPRDAPPVTAGSQDSSLTASSSPPIWRYGPGSATQLRPEPEKPIIRQDVAKNRNRAILEILVRQVPRGRVDGEEPEKKIRLESL
jgi:hypothetical protein